MVIINLILNSGVIVSQGDMTGQNRTISDKSDKERDDSMTNGIQGKVILITGASSGIGYATAKEAARKGARLGLAARRENHLIKLTAELQASGTETFYAVTDVCRREEVDRFIRLAKERYGRIDVLINNAGYGMRATVEETTVDDFQGMLQVNLMGTFHGIQAVLPIMKQQKSGHIINVSSVVGKRAMPQSGAYSATKFAVNGLSEALRVELKAYGIRVSTVMPASTATEFFAVAGKKTGKPAKPAGPLQSSETVARAIRRCIEHPRSEVLPLRVTRLLVIANAVMPGLLDRLVRRYMTMH